MAAVAVAAVAVVVDGVDAEYDHMAIGSSAFHIELHVGLAVAAYPRRAADCLVVAVGVEIVVVVVAAAAAVAAVVAVAAEWAFACPDSSFYVELVGSEVVAMVAAVTALVNHRCWLPVAECFGQSICQPDPACAWPAQCILHSMASLYYYYTYRSYY